MELELVGPEIDLLYRSVVGEGNDVIPGWYWFAGDDADQATKRLLDLATYSSDETVRVQATKLITEIGVLLDVNGRVREDIATALLEDRDIRARSTKVDFFAVNGILADLPALHRLIEDPNAEIRAKASQAQLRIVARADPQRILTELMEQRQSFFRELGEEITKQSDRISSETLLLAIQSANGEVRQLAGYLLARRNAVSADIANFMREKHPGELEGVYLPVLFQAGQISLDNISHETREKLHLVIIERLGKQSPKELLDKVAWYSLEGREAYEAMAKYHFSSMSDVIRADLRDGFDRLRRESMQKFASKFGEEACELMTASWGELERFIRQDFSGEALESLVKSGGPEDASIARQYLSVDDKRNRIAAIKLLVKHGDVSDSTQLLDLAHNEWSVRETAGAGYQAFRPLSKRLPIAVGVGQC